MCNSNRDCPDAGLNTNDRNAIEDSLNRREGAVAEPEDQSESYAVCFTKRKEKFGGKLCHLLGSYYCHHRHERSKSHRI